MELITFSLLCVTSISAASSGIKASQNPETKFYYDEAFLPVAERYISINRPSKSHDTVFSYLRQGLSVPTATTGPMRSDKFNSLPSSKVESCPFSSVNPNTKMSPAKLRSFSRSYSGSGSDFGSNSYEITSSPSVSINSNASVYNSPDNITWVTPHGLPVQTISRDKSFRIHLGGLLNIGKLISFIPDILDFQRIVNEKYLPLFLSSYVFIPSGTLNPNFVSRMATKSLAIKSVFSSEKIGFKLSMLSASIGDLVIFDTIRAIVLDSNIRGKSTITIIFNDRIDNLKHLVKNALKNFLDFSLNGPANYYIWGSQSN